MSTALREAFKKYMSEEKPYTEPTLYDAGGDQTKKWYVNYTFRNPDSGRFERFKPTFDMNRWHGNDRVRYAREAVKFMKEMLERGYDPFVEQKQNITPPVRQISQITSRTEQAESIEPILKAVEKAKKEVDTNATKNARETYVLMFNRFKKFILAKGYEDLPVEKLDSEKVYEFQDYLKDELHLAKKTVNATLSHIGMFWDTKYLKKITKANNPFRNISPLKAKDYRGKEKREDAIDNDYVPLTSDEMDTVISYYKRIEANDFLRLLGMVYYAWVRPVEVSRLRIADIDLKNRIIRFRKEETKSKKFAHVQIVEELYELLKGMDLHTYPSTYFIFSRDLRPGSEQADAWKHYTNTWWNPHVVEQLGIDKRMYSAKHTGNIEWVLRNKGKYDMKWQQMQNRHESITTTEQYMKRLGVYFVETDQFKFRSFI